MGMFGRPCRAALLGLCALVALAACGGGAPPAAMPAPVTPVAASTYTPPPPPPRPPAAFVALAIGSPTPAASAAPAATPRVALGSPPTIPTPPPSLAPTVAPTPTTSPTSPPAPTAAPTPEPSAAPSPAPSAAPSIAPPVAIPGCESAAAPAIARVALASGTPTASPSPSPGEPAATQRPAPPPSRSPAIPFGAALATAVTARTPTAPPAPTPTVAATATPTPTPVPTVRARANSQTAEELRLGIEALVAGYAAAGSGVAGVVVAERGGATIAAVEADRVFATASLYKLFILWGVQRAIAAGDLADDTPLTFCPADDDSKEDGSVPWDYGERVTVAELREAMITASHNSAAWLLARTVGWDAVDQLLASRGFANSRAAGGVSTPREIARLLDGIERRTLDPRLRPADYAAMLALLRAQRINGYLSPGFPPQAIFAHKTGNLPGVLNDAGLLLPDGRAITIAVMTEGDEAASLALMREVAALVWAYYGR